MKNLIIIFALLAVIGFSAKGQQPFTVSQAEKQRLEPIDLSYLQRVKDRLNPVNIHNRSIHSLLLDYQGLDALAATDSGGTAEGFRWDINQNFTDVDAYNYGLNWAATTFPSLWDVNTLVEYPVAGTQITVDSIVVFFLHENMTGTSDVVTITIYEYTGALGILIDASDQITNNVLYQQSFNWTTSMAPLGGAGFQPLIIRPNITLPVGGRFTVGVTFTGNVANTFSLSATYADLCLGNCGGEESVVPNNSFYRLILEQPGGSLSGVNPIFLDCFDDDVLTPGYCEHFYIQNFGVLAFIHADVPSPSVTISASANPICAGQSAILNAIPSGGAPGYSYLWNTGATSSSVIVSPNINTTYSVTVTDNNAQSATASKLLTVIPLPVVSISGLNSSYQVSQSPVQLTGAPSGGSFSGPGVQSGFFNPASAGVGVHTITYLYTDNNGCSNSAMAVVNVTPTLPWTVAPTGDNHSIYIDPNLVSDIGGSPIATGDYVGAFYNDNGTMKPGGIGYWDGNPLVFPAYGNDASPPSKNGFNGGEEFYFKVWKASNQQEYEVQATYIPIGGLGTLVTHTNTFAIDGFSGITSFVSCSTQDIPIITGWSMISSYIDPDVLNVLDILNPISSDILLIKNGDGQTAIPSLAINSIGNWDVTRGYKVKASNATILTMGCEQVDPVATPISLPVGWSIMSYLRNSQMNIATAMAGIASNILLVKNGVGNTYIPSLSLNTIGNMAPGQGYKIKLSSASVLTYPANSKAGVEYDYHNPAKPLRYDISLNSGNNATIVIPLHSVHGKLIQGDEIGIFNKQGKLVGSAVYEERNLAITVWGDDQTTEKEVEGMMIGEEYSYQVWRTLDGKEITLAPQYDEGYNYYTEDGISILKGMSLKLSSQSFEYDLTCYPNPSSGLISFSLDIQEPADVNIRIYDLLGKVVAEITEFNYSVGRHIDFDASHFPEGRFLYRASINGEISTRSFVISR